MATEALSRRDEVLSVAASLFRDRGYHGTSMKDLASGLGILRGSIYAHIDSKEDLLFDIVDRGADLFIARMETVLQTSADAEAKLRMAIEAHVVTVAEQMDASTVFLNDWKFLSPGRRKLIESKRNRYEDMVAGIIREGVASGAFRPDLDHKYALLLVLSAVNWLYQWYDPSGPDGPTQIAAKLSEMILPGITSKDRRAK